MIPKLRLYISDTLYSSQALINLQQLLTEELQGYTLEVINVVDNPDLAEQEKIIATPVLERLSPTPVKRIVGNLNSDRQILEALGHTKREY